MGKIFAAIKSPLGMFVVGMAVGVIVDRKTGFISKALAATVGRIPTVGPMVLG
jgi:hypothetical protein